MTKILHLELDSCYYCPDCCWYDHCEDQNWEGEDTYFCLGAWNNDETGKHETDFALKDFSRIPNWCPLPDKVGE